MRVVDQHAEIVPMPEQPVKALRGMLRADTSLAAKLLEERKKDDPIDEKRRV